MSHFDQGPGRNIEFCLITTGINLDPHNGGIAEVWYEWFKDILQEKAEIHFENNQIRELHDINVTDFLKAYDATPRSLYQFLFGLVEHNNAWTEEGLIAAINDAPLPTRLRPQDGEYSLAFEQSRDAGTKLFENVVVSTFNVWAEKQELYMSDRLPISTDGSSGDVWLVSRNGVMELWYKPAFSWIRLNDYVTQVVPAGEVFYSTIDPGNAVNRWWYDPTGITFRKYDEQLNIWEAPPVLICSLTPPSGLNDGELWLTIVDGTFILNVWDATSNKFKQVKISAFPVQDKNFNSAFKWVENDNNFDLVCDETAFLGGPIGGGGSSLEIRKDGALIQTAVECINFIGPDLDVSVGANCVDVEHLPVTTLPEQISDPVPTTDAGKVYTIDINGITELFYIDNTGDIIQLTNNGSTTQNIFLAVSTFSAVAGQTVFTVPTSAKAVMTVKINGLDTLGFTFTSPSVTYNPVAGGYTIQMGDEVTVIYYA